MRLSISYTWASPPLASLPLDSPPLGSKLSFENTSYRWTFATVGEKKSWFFRKILQSSDINTSGYSGTRLPDYPPEKVTTRSYTMPDFYDIPVTETTRYPSFKFYTSGYAKIAEF